MFKMKQIILNVLKVQLEYFCDRQTSLCKRQFDERTVSSNSKAFEVYFIKACLHTHSLAYTHDFK